MYLLWIRHGFTYQNLESFLEKRGAERDNIDSVLTESGKIDIINNVEKLFDKIRKRKGILPPVIFTSILKRTIQTADLINKGSSVDRAIIPVPYIEEDIGEHEPIIIDIKQSLQDIQVEILKYNGIKTFDEDGIVLYNSNVDKFYEEVLPIIVNSIKESYKESELKNIVIPIVSHGNVIENISGNFVSNFGAVLESLDDSKKRFEMISKGIFNKSSIINTLISNSNNQDRNL